MGDRGVFGAYYFSHPPNKNLLAAAVRIGAASEYKKNVISVLGQLKMFKLHQHLKASSRSKYSVAPAQRPRPHTRHATFLR